MEYYYYFHDKWGERDKARSDKRRTNPRFWDPMKSTFHEVPKYLLVPNCLVHAPALTGLVPSQHKYCLLHLTSSATWQLATSNFVCVTLFFYFLLATYQKPTEWWILETRGGRGWRIWVKVYGFWVIKKKKKRWVKGGT